MVWDAFSPQPQKQERRLFDGSNVGNAFLTNTLHNGAIVADDQHAVLWNWYARTTVATGRSNVLHDAWSAYAQLAIVTLLLNGTPVTQCRLADLLARAPGQPMLGKTPLAHVPTRAHVHVTVLANHVAAERLAVARSHITGSSIPDPLELAWIHLEGRQERVFSGRRAGVGLGWGG